MPKEPEDAEREDRISDEIIVDCYDEYERYSGWWNYLRDLLDVPFRARSISDSVQTVLKKHEEVEVIELLESDSGAPESIRVLVKWQDRTFAAPLSELEPMDTDEGTIEAVEDWRYWVARGHHF